MSLLDRDADEMNDFDEGRLWDEAHRRRDENMTETREEKIKRLQDRAPDVPEQTVESIVDAVENAIRAEEAEAASARANSLLGTLDPMYT